MFETQIYIPPGPLSDFSMNLFLAKQVHHLLGFPSGVSKTFSQTLWPNNRNISRSVLYSGHFSVRPTCFVSELEEILSDEIRLLGSAGLRVDAIEGEPNVTCRDQMVSERSTMIDNYYQEYQILQWPESTSPADLGSCWNISVAS